MGKVGRLEAERFAELSVQSQDRLERHGVAELVENLRAHGRVGGHAPPRRDVPVGVHG